MTVGGIVLAGGRSTRMGEPKALLDWHGVPLVRHIVDQLPHPTLVVAAPGQPLPPGLDVVHDPVEGRGPLQGLAVGLEALDADVAFVCATDQPFAPQLLPHLLDALGDADAAALPRQPLGALYRTALAGRAAERLPTDASLKGLLHAVDTRWIDGDAALLRSLDTPDDYREAVRSSGGRAC